MKTVSQLKKQRLMPQWMYGVLCWYCLWFSMLPTMAQDLPPASTKGTGKYLFQRFPTPQGFKRKVVGKGTFAHYLRHLPLKPPGSEVRYYDGRIKKNNGVYSAVVDLPIGTKDLHQCADALIRLKAEYLFQQRDFDAIHFNFTNGFRADYRRWRSGERVRVEGNQARWLASSPPDGSYANFWRYLETVFAYAGTLSLEQELRPLALKDLSIGDLFLQGGSPGHGVIVVDMATAEDGRQVFLLAQSYMPAQEIQLLNNPMDPQLSPWYSTDFGEVLYTPEWTFHRTHLKRFAER